MHGRLKVRSTQEQEEAKRKEKERKVVWYREKKSSINTKRAAGDKDNEALKLTEEVLMENSDEGALWNYRREILQEKILTLACEEMNELCKYELNLLERCLRTNPKAYCVWLHRKWVLEHSQNPHWGHEKSLCDLFLKYDERNFHCWDYRRYIIQQSNVPAANEFEYTTDKIAANFSNYSAWHYRSKLLPLLHPSSTNSSSIDESALEKEHELVQNAFYTDPSDQSAWFYHKWLLGRGKRDIAMGVALLQRGQGDTAPSITVSFNQCVKSIADVPITVTIDGSPPIHMTESDWPRALWSCDLPTDIISNKEITVKVERGETSITVTLHEGAYRGVWLTNELNELFMTRVTNAPIERLTSELSMCRELLDLEPDNKWCLLTTLQLMEAIDYQKYHEEIMRLFEKLILNDSLRSGYYRDLRSRHMIGITVRKQLEENSQSLNLSSQDLTKLYFTQHMMCFQSVDLSNNRLCEVNSLEGLGNLVSVQTLSLASNQLEAVPLSLKELLNLKSLDLGKNDIKELDDLLNLKCLPSIEELAISGNPVCELGDWEGVIRTHLPKLNALKMNDL